MGKQNYREMAESQQHWGVYNKAAFELRDWLVQEKMIIPADTPDIDSASMVGCIRDNEGFCAVQISTLSPDQVTKLQLKVKEMSFEKRMSFRVLLNRTRQHPAEAEINSFPPEFGQSPQPGTLGRLSVIFFDESLLR